MSSEKESLITPTRDSFAEDNQVTWAGELKQTAIILLSVLLLCGGIFVATYFFSTSVVNSGLDTRLQNIFFSKISPETCKSNLQMLTRTLHMAGTNESDYLGREVASRFASYLGPLATIKTERYDVLLSYPTESSTISVLNADLTPKHTVQLFENKEAVDPQTNANELKEARAFTAYSPSGTHQTAEYYYVNYARVEDFEYLKSKGVVLTNSIVIARYGMNFRGIKVQNAEKEGCRGILIYSDPQQDGPSHGPVFPNGEMRSESSMQRGTGAYINMQPGDPLTPNGPSIPGQPRIKREDAINLPQKIMVSPISPRDARAIMSNLGGEVAPTEWIGSLGITYRLGGAGNGNTILKVNIQNTESVRSISNVFATIKGEIEPDRQVIVGNHRDAWTYGAVDPHTGTMALLEFAKGFGYLIQNSKWRPRRSIVFASWDAEEFGLIGSTEWVEHHYDLLKSQTVAYLNMDTNSGKKFSASSSPSLSNVIREEAQKLQSPNYANMTLGEEWDGKTTWVGSGSDDSPFFHHLGVSTVSMSFDNAIGVPGVYHSLYETNYLVNNFVDSNFAICTTSAQIWGLVAIRLVNDDLLAFNVTEQATFIGKEYASLKANPRVIAFNSSLVGAQKVQFDSAIVALELSLDKLTSVSDVLMNEMNTLKNIGRQGKNYEARVRIANDRAMGLERAFTAKAGLKGREWYKHVLCAPGKQSGYGASSFPGIYDAIVEKNFDNVMSAISQINVALAEL